MYRNCLSKLYHKTVWISHKCSQNLTSLIRIWILPFTITTCTYRISIQTIFQSLWNIKPLILNLHKMYQISQNAFFPLYISQERRTIVMNVVNTTCSKVCVSHDQMKDNDWWMRTSTVQGQRSLHVLHKVTSHVINSCDMIMLYMICLPWTIVMRIGYHIGVVIMHHRTCRGYRNKCLL